MSSPKASWQAKWVMTALAVLLVLSVPVTAGRGVRKAGGQFITFLQQFGDEEPAQTDTSQTIGSEPLLIYTEIGAVIRAASPAPAADSPPATEVMTEDRFGPPGGGPDESRFYGPSELLEDLDEEVAP